MKWILFFVLTVGALFLIWRAVRQAPQTGATSAAAVSPSVGGNAAREETHYSPFENLEALDYRALGGAKHRIDIAMYAMTDRYLASELIGLADRGVAIRIYRDGEQWQAETRNGSTIRSRTCCAATRESIAVSPAAPELCFVCSLWLGVSLG